MSLLSVIGLNVVGYIAIMIYMRDYFWSRKMSLVIAYMKQFVVSNSDITLRQKQILLAEISKVADRPSWWQWRRYR